MSRFFVLRFALISYISTAAAGAALLAFSVVAFLRHAIYDSPPPLPYIGIVAPRYATSHVIFALRHLITPHCYAIDDADT